MGAMLDFFARPAAMTSGGRHAHLFDALPAGSGALAGIVQGLVLHEHLATAYGVTLSDARRAESQLRSAAAMLDRILALDARPLTQPRPPAARLVGVCRHFTVLLAAMLRAQGVPARARCGFGAWFAPPGFEDHWECEVWNGTRWTLADAQLDALQREKFGIGFDPLDVPRDRFVIAGDAWARCRAGEADPDSFGIFDLRGLWFIAGNVVRDAAALNAMEMLPWDVWGAMVQPGEVLDDAQLAFVDRLAALTRAPDASFEELRALYGTDARLRVPATVFNALRNRLEAV